MRIDFYFTKKRINSMIRPDTDEAQVTVTSFDDFYLKDATDLNHPVFVIAASNMPETNYCILSGTGYTTERPQKVYYFVNKIEQARKTVWNIHCTVDVLATWKSEILPQSAFVVRSTSKFNPYIIDNMLPSNNEINVRRAVGWIDGKYIANANANDLTIMLALAATPTSEGTLMSGVPVYAMNRSTAQDVIANLTSPSNAQVIAQQFGGNLSSAIMGAWICPIKYSEITSTHAVTAYHINVGGYDLLANTGQKTAKQLIVPYFESSITGTATLAHYGDFRDIPPFRNYVAHIPYMGYVEPNTNTIIMANRLSGDGSVKAQINTHYDFCSGTKRVAMYLASHKVLDVEFCAKAEIPISSAGKTIAGMIAGAISAIGGIGSVGGNNSIAYERANLPLDGNATINTVARNAQNLLGSKGIDLTNFGSMTSIVGGYSGSLLGGTDAEISLMEIHNYCSVEPLSVGELLGRPYHGIAQLSTLSGFVKTDAFCCQGRMTTEEKEMIETMFNTNGVYL